MALVRGKKATQVTPSSIASRMGVVPTYGGDWLATAAESIGKNIDVQTKRIAVMEEEKWKAQFSIDTYKAINKFAMDNRVNPNGFTKSVDAYVNTLVNQVPNRYKGWAKQYAGMMAAREGQQIINRHYNNQQAELIKVNEDSNQIWLDNTLRNLEQTPYAEYDNEVMSSVLAEFAEKAASYENMYNSLDPQYRSGLPTPDQWKRKHQLGFEGARLNSKHRALLEAAQILDKEYLLQQDLNGDDKYQKSFDKKEGQKTNVEIAIAQIKKNMQEYLNNPDVDNLDGFSTLVNSTGEERNQLKANAEEYVDNLYNQMSTEQNNIKNAIAAEYKENINVIESRVKKPYTSITDEQLLRELNLINATVEDRERITLENTKSNIIGALSKVLFSSDPNTTEIMYKNKDYNIGQYNKTWTGTIGRIKELMLANGVPESEINDQEIKNQIIEQHIYDMTGRTSNTLSLEYDFVMLNNELVADESKGHFFQLKQYALNMGVVPPIITEYITENLNNPLNLEKESNRDSLIEIAGMLHSLQEVPSVAGMGIEGVSKEQQMLLAEFYKDYKNYRENTSGGIIESDFIKNWFELHNEYTQDESDKLLNVFNDKLQDLDQDVLANQMRQHMEMAAISIFGVNFGTAIGTGVVQEPAVKPLIDVPILNIFKVKDYEKEELQYNVMVEELLDRLPNYMVSYYKTRGKPITEKDLKVRTVREIENDINEIVKFALSDLNAEGYGFE